jgi:hypothetical protein
LKTLFAALNVLVILKVFVILNLFQDNTSTSHVILKQVQDDEGGCLFGDDACVTVILKVNVIAYREFPTATPNSSPKCRFI